MSTSRLAGLSLLAVAACGGGASPPARTDGGAIDGPATQPVRLASAIKTNDLIVDADGIYLLDPAGDPDTRVVRMSKLDGSRTVLASGIRLASNLRADATDLYFDPWTTEGNAIQTISKQGGAVRTIPGVRSLSAFHGDRLYWIENSSGNLKHPLPPVLDLFSIAKTGGAATHLWSEMKAGGDRIAADQSGVFFEADGELRLLPRGATEPIKLADLGAFSPAFVSVMMTDELALYVGLGDGSLMKVSKQGGASVKLGMVRGFPIGVTLDATHLYFTDTEAGTVGRIAKSGGSTEVLARAQARPVAITVDESSVYWVNIGDGTLMKQPKPGG